MGLILATALVLQQLTTGFSMALAVGLQQLTSIGVYVVPGKVLPTLWLEHNNLLMSFYWQ